MAKSNFQQGAIKRYYENRDTMALQNLGEIASDLFLCEDSKTAARLWDRVGKALKHTDAPPATIEKILANRDIAELGKLVNQLAAPGKPGASPSPASPPTSLAKPAAQAPQPPAPQEQQSDDPMDPQVQKRAMKAFRKRLKLTRLDEESKLGRSPLTGGKSLGTMAITPPRQYPPAVWEELAKQGKLKRAGTGFYTLAQ